MNNPHGQGAVTFVPGAELARLLYQTGVRQVLDRHFPRLPHSAGLVGRGSEVLGFDTERSADHHWGPRLTLFLRPDDARVHGAEIDRALAYELPLTIAGYPTHFDPPGPDGSRMMRRVTQHPIAHRVEVTSVREELQRYAGLSEYREMSALDWLVTPQQVLLTLSSGPVFHDGLGELEAMQRALRWYPCAVWRALLAAQWRRIEQEEAFPGRCAEVGDELGSRVVTALLVRDLMRLAFLMERRYAPYGKWFGTAFARLTCAPILLPVLDAALGAAVWAEREAALVAAYRVVAGLHNDLELTEPLPIEPSPFWSRPFQVIHGDRFAAALSNGLDPALVALAIPRIGAIDQWTDSTNVLSYPAQARRATGMYPPTDQGAG